MFEKNFIDITLSELALIYMRRKNIPLNTGNLFWIMEKICKRLDRINKNTKEKKIKFAGGQCEFEKK